MTRFARFGAAVSEAAGSWASLASAVKPEEKP
jgi:hypothetical protein